MLIHQVQLEASQMPRELLVRDTQPVELGRHDIHALRRSEGCDWLAVLGQYLGDHLDIRRLQRYGKFDIKRKSFG